MNKCNCNEPFAALPRPVLVGGGQTASARTASEKAQSQKAAEDKFWSDIVEMAVPTLNSNSKYKGIYPILASGMYESKGFELPDYSNIYYFGNSNCYNPDYKINVATGYFITEHSTSTSDTGIILDDPNCKPIKDLGPSPPNHLGKFPIKVNNKYAQQIHDYIKNWKLGIIIPKSDGDYRFVEIKNNKIKDI